MLEELVVVVVEVVEVVTDVDVLVTVFVGAVTVLVELTVLVGIVRVVDVVDDVWLVVDLLDLPELCVIAYAIPPPIRSARTTARAIQAPWLRSFGRRSCPHRGQKSTSVETMAWQLGHCWTVGLAPGGCCSCGGSVMSAR